MTQHIPTFKTEASLWDMLADHSKRWDARKVDPGAWRWQALVNDHPRAKVVAFENKDSGDVLYFKVRGIRRAGTKTMLGDYGDGWYFILLGQEVAP